MRCARARVNITDYEQLFLQHNANSTGISVKIIIIIILKIIALFHRLFICWMDASQRHKLDNGTCYADKHANFDVIIGFIAVY